ncbi:MAG: hypothetical protein PWQ29_45 [Verrucomicrobiota bacterium]|jgi:hypothetical protein|nr:hypothetical protein [Verrucomicrobiota bacterium]MDK2962651.1 hypothetical protein [Verrucomicrobiota bacterium]
MIPERKPNRNAWLWWISVITLAIGISIYVFLEPAEYDVEIQRIRSAALVLSILVAGLCIIIGTAKRWFGKGL